MIDPDGGLDLLVVDGLESLSDKSFVRIDPTDHGEPRFKRHTLLSEFAADRLDEAGERAECERRHAMAFLELAETAGPHLGGPRHRSGWSAWRSSRHNVRAAMHWSLTVDEPDVGLRIVAATWRFWQQTVAVRRGRRPGRGTCSRIRSRGSDIRVRIDALAAQGGIGYWANDFATTRAAYTERLALAEELWRRTGASPRRTTTSASSASSTTTSTSCRSTRRSRSRSSSASACTTASSARARRASSSTSCAASTAEARELEVLNLAQFEKAGARLRMSDSLMLLAVASIFIDDLAAGRDYLTRSLRLTSGVVTDELAGLVVSSHFALPRRTRRGRRASRRGGPGHLRWRPG